MENAGIVRNGERVGFLIRNPAGNRYGFIVYENGRAIKSLLPNYTQKNAMEKLNAYLGTETEVKSA
jgi:hypothetical protein